VIGAAYVPLHTHFAPAHDIFLKGRCTGGPAYHIVATWLSGADFRRPATGRYAVRRRPRPGEDSSTIEEKMVTGSQDDL